MKHQFRNSKGSALLIAVAVLLIFSILGISLLTLTTNGLAKNETRENIVQATDLADKGVEFAVKEIQKKLETQIKETPMGKTDFGMFLDSTLKNLSLKCPSTSTFPDTIGFKIAANNQGYTKVCIEKVEPIPTNGRAEEKNYIKELSLLKVLVL